MAEKKRSKQRKTRYVLLMLMLAILVPPDVRAIRWIGEGTYETFSIVWLIVTSAVLGLTVGLVVAVNTLEDLRLYLEGNGPDVGPKPGAAERRLARLDELGNAYPVGFDVISKVLSPIVIAIGTMGVALLTLLVNKLL